MAKKKVPQEDSIFDDFEVTHSRRVDIPCRRTSVSRHWVIRWGDQHRVCCGQTIVVADADRVPWMPDEENGVPWPRVAQCGTCGASYSADFDSTAIDH